MSGIAAGAERIGKRKVNLTVNQRIEKTKIFKVSFLFLLCNFMAIINDTGS